LNSNANHQNPLLPVLCRQATEQSEINLVLLSDFRSTVFEFGNLKNSVSVMR
jgi:hypothetical protein